MAFAPLDGDRDDEPIVAEINVTPLTDIFLVLLIIFMVTSTALTQQSTPVDLPRAGGAGDQAAGVVVTAAADGRLDVDGKRVDLAGLRETLRTQLEQSASKNVILQGDRSIVLERAIEIMTAAKEAGAVKIAIATQPQQTSGR